MKAKRVYLFFGIQGSGKGTQAERLAESLQLPYFESGQQLRDIAAQQSELGEEIRSVQLNGGLVSSSILRRVINNYITKYGCEEGLVIDGFPRNREQVALLEDLAQEHGWRLIIIELKLSKESAVKRLLNRTEVIDGQVTRRPDDNPDSIERRIQTFFNETRPLIDDLASRYTLIEINGEPDIDSITNEIKKRLEQLGND